MREDLVVIGGGVMGLFTAYHASERVDRVVVLERGRIGDPMTASFGRTRSYRSDYLDPGYARLAREALRLWEEFERQTGTAALIRCGCMNIAKRSVTPDLRSTYGHRSHRVLEELGVPSVSLAGKALRARFPYLEADVGYLDLDGGVVNLPAVTAALQRTLADRGVRIVEGITTRLAARCGSEIRVVTDVEEWASRSVVVTAGHGTNEVLARLNGARLQVPLTRDRPIEAKYFTPPADFREQFASNAMPVIAYLDAGIYCHPIINGLIDKVKIGYYHPPDLPRAVTTIDSVMSFVEHCAPTLLEARIEPVDDVDGCDYDLVADDEFVLGAVPGFPGAYVGVGWRGTGYKFAPWVGRVLADLAVERDSMYDVRRFDPARFTKGRFHAGSAISANA
ncbi:MAG: FAD-dependent oxidoreductase [Solirubrobacterales bacterium]|nr:FAD-dependent oxidoreductase [Solirubrobacterales bacterium]MBV9808962.1 FAD-dependent oxidoreductase [Solirubrobacterales bacterium]